MKNVMFASFLLGIFILLSGCASTSITSYTDPDYRAVQFKNILVVANTNKLGDRLGMENRIVEVLVTNGIKSIPSYSILPPTREFSDTQKKEVMLDSKIDGCLMINFGEQGVQEISIPVMGSTSQTQLIGNKLTTSTQYIGGQTFTKPYAEFEIKLFDVVNGKMAWIGNSFTGGNAYSNFINVYQSFCNKIIERLSEDNLISKSENITKINEKEIDDIISMRDDNSNINKSDFVILNNGEILTGVIISKEYTDFNHTIAYIDFLGNDKVRHKILIKDIREVYQK